MKSRRFGTLALLAIVAAVTSGALLAQAPQGIGTWVSVGEVGAALSNGAVVAMPDGRTLIAGGTLADGTLTDGVTIYDPVDNSVVGAGVLTSPRTGHTATLLKDGRVLVVGGRTADGLVFSDIEAFDPMTGTSTIVALLPEPRTGHVAAGLLDGTVLIAGGATTDAASLQTAVLFDPETASVSPAAGGLQMPRLNASATTLLDGRVLVVGGSNGTAELASAEIYDRYSQSFAIAATLMSVGRQGHSAVLLPHNGGVLIAGGTSNGVAQAGADLFLPAVFPDPFSYGEGEFTSTGAMTVARTGAVAGPTNVEGYAFASSGGSADTDVYRFATIKTDKDDYAPGELAVITGSGWQPGEEVTLLFQEDPAVHEDYVLNVTADSAGNIFWNQWAPEHHDIGVRFYLTASGSQSRAQMTFTDASKLGSLTVGAQVGTLTSGTSGDATYVITVNRATGNGTNGAFIANLTVTTTLPTGVTGSFSTNPVSFSPTDTSKQVTLTLHTTPQTPADSTAFTVRASISSADFTEGSGALTINQGVWPSTTTVSCPASVTYDGSAQTPCSATVTGSGLNQSVTVTYTSNINAGTATATATFPGDATHESSSDTKTFTINKADAVCAITGHTGAYDGAIHGASGSCTGVGDDPTAAGSSLNLGATYTNAPGGTANWSFTGGPNFNDQNGSVAITIDKADAQVVVNGYTGVYDAATHGATGTATGVGGADLSANLSLGASFTDAPGGIAHWTFNGGTNYANQSGDVAIDIAKANAIVNVSGYTGIYDGAEHGATGTATGLGDADLSGSLNLGETFIDAPGGTAHWTFSGGTNYNDQTGEAAIVINKADALVSVSGYDGTYDASPHGATGTATGVNGVDLSASLDFGDSFTNVPGGTANWLFNGGANYNDQSGSVAITISKIDATCTITGYTGAYDGAAHGASGSCTGIDSGSAAGSSLDLGDTFANVPGGTAHWSFDGGMNYNDQSGTAAITISKADAVCTINGYTGTYDGTAHGASGSCAGADDGAAAGSTLDLGASFTNVPGGTASWSFSGGTNYNDQSGSVAITLGKANAIVTVNGYTGVFDAQAHGATGTAVGVMSESLAGLNLGGTFTNVPGGTAHWTFTDVTGNYNNDSGDAAIVITKAAPHVTVTGYSGVYNGQPHGAYGHASGVLGEALPGLNLGASFTNVPGGTAHWTFTDQTGNYSNASGDAQIVIYKATANCSITGYDVMFDDAFHTATGTCTGVTGAPLSGLNLSATTHKDAGVYTDSWTFTDVTGNYNDTNGSVGDRIGHWTASGFYQPVDMSGAQIVWNTVKGGSTVPLKFNLYAGALKKTNVADVLGFAIAPMECSESALVSDVEFTTTGGTSLRYDGTAGQFIQNWQTPKMPGTCFAVQLTAKEASTTIVAYFKLK